ncbi:MAG: tetratricopeptide repeat protein [Deltaproteobacteria bacterium]|nr:tetratricopeptide repeat protein [Deltaproteobacteria bacterium]MBW1953487.1 tetratricopeptide repeat protein [Deltaproteobacteria bacterium]MBW1986348.1 tetratricopeptide repeat protein [Deltaproteobacteria bacterium]MBW2134390.1 tetratricopeptide repeat protein [Deltaproteobacteria bacterium]
MRYPKRLVFLALLSALTIFLSQCARNQAASKPRLLSKSEFADFSEAYSSWSDRRSSSKTEGLSDEQLEALADMFSRLGEYESSLFNYLQLLKDQPENYHLMYKIGVIFLLRGQLKAAQKMFAQVLLHQPDMLEAHEALGLINLLSKQYSKAINEFRLVLDSDSQRQKARYFLGITYLGAGEPRKAISELEAAARFNPDNLATIIALGRAHNELKQYQQAITWLDKGKSLDPKNVKINRQLGIALAGLKRYREALQAFQQAGDEAQAYNNIGVYYFMDGKYEEAAKCFQLALELSPTFYDNAKANLDRALKKLNENKPVPDPT